ncbi:universal stress protein [Bizionia myxarmorum]|uniref:Universal stress protein n=1 Tax=Bizionia myxarmorum TaxID=291186 RepID=A0A5D0QXS3_9FLAO|nr:universal stress protein [Bizionia myxarmorum]TYB74002.1 universal stress protein [Bizionia myxarmorum]
MRKNILLPTDFSDNAWTAALYALKLYESEPCTFYFLHSSKLKASSMTNMSSKLSRVISENALNDLTSLKQKAESINKLENHRFEIILSTFDLKDAMEGVAEQQEINMVIMGTKGTTKAKGIVFGSNTINTMKSLKTCPVLAIPDDYEFREPKQIAFPTDFNRNYGDELKPLKDVSKLYNSTITVVHVNKEDDITEAQDYNLDQLKISLEKYPHTFHWMPNHGKIEQGIKDFIDQFDMDMLVMINYQHSFIESIMNEPVIKKLGFQPTLPFLVIPCLN